MKRRPIAFFGNSDCCCTGPLLTNSHRSLSLTTVGHKPGSSLRASLSFGWSESETAAVGLLTASSTAFLSSLSSVHDAFSSSPPPPAASTAGPGGTSSPPAPSTKTFVSGGVVTLKKLVNFGRASVFSLASSFFFLFVAPLG